jgi:hypothetical protein
VELRKRATYALGALSVAVVVAACSGGATPTPQGDAEAAACAAIQTWSDEMRAFAALEPATASIEDVSAQAGAVKAAWSDVKSSLEGVEAADEAAVVAAGATLEAALGDFSTDVPVTDAIAEVKTAADPLKAAYGEMADGLGCAIATPY